jgi:ADP-heptose:LPS heptosyltransferase
LKLIELLKARNLRCQAVVGEVERERWPAEAIVRLKSAVEVVQPTNYVKLYEMLSGSAAFVGNDSGPGHLAGIIGVPTLALFGPTNPSAWKPLGPRVQTIHQPLDSLAPEAVARTLGEMIAGAA